jgi:hypothetical protein
VQRRQPSISPARSPGGITDDARRRNHRQARRLEAPSNGVKTMLKHIAALKRRHDRIDPMALRRDRLTTGILSSI